MMWTTTMRAKTTVMTTTTTTTMIDADLRTLVKAVVANLASAIRMKESKTPHRQVTIYDTGPHLKSPNRVHMPER